MKMATAERLFILHRPTCEFSGRKQTFCWVELYNRQSLENTGVHVHVQFCLIILISIYLNEFQYGHATPNRWVTTAKINEPIIGVSLSQSSFG